MFLAMHNWMRAEPVRATIERIAPLGYKALEIMEQQLRRHAFIATDNYNIADIALFAYTHVADEGGFKLDDYAAIREWITTIKGRPNFVPMAQT